MATQLKTALNILRLKQLMARIQLCRSSVYGRLDPKSRQYDATFPKPIKLGASAVGWIEEEIQTWIEAKIAATRSIATKDGGQ